MIHEEILKKCIRKIDFPELTDEHWDKIKCDITFWEAMFKAMQWAAEQAWEEGAMAMQKECSYQFGGVMHYRSSTKERIARERVKNCKLPDNPYKETSN